MATYSFELFNTISIWTTVQIEADSYAQAVQIFSLEADLKEVEWEANWSDRAFMAGVDSITREEDEDEDAEAKALCMKVLWSSNQNGFDPKDVEDQAKGMDAMVEQMRLEEQTAQATSNRVSLRL